jgi:exoribonuclease-2
MTAGTPGGVNLIAIARDAMRDRGFLIDFPAAALQQADRAVEPSFEPRPGLRDLGEWFWSSIDNDDSRDLDQLEFARKEPAGIRLYVAVAQVDPFVPKDSPLDSAAQHNTTSVYPGVQTFPMLPESLSTNLSSLVEKQKRAAVVFEFLVGDDGKILESAAYPAVVTNKAQLTYNAVAAWLGTNTSGPPLTLRQAQGGERSRTTARGGDVQSRMLDKIRANRELQEQLSLQDQAAQALRRRRHESGALTLQAIEFRPAVTTRGEMTLGAHVSNRATQLIEDLMIAANQASVNYLLSKNFPTLRRVVRIPRRWDRIMEIAALKGDRLPPEPDSERLEQFLCRQQQRDPERFPDLSLAIIKLLGRGEYAINVPGRAGASLPAGGQGHFSLAVEKYSHSTAPNRRYPDILTQRLLLAAMGQKPVPYPISELDALAAHCTKKEDDANKVERSVHKSIAAVALSRRVGEIFSGFITGASEKGIWVRIVQPPVEGKVMGRVPRLDVGDSVLVRLVETNPYRGYIDFEFVKRG